jgi:hypothetical protein
VPERCREIDRNGASIAVTIAMVAFTMMAIIAITVVAITAVSMRSSESCGRQHNESERAYGDLF